MFYRKLINKRKRFELFKFYTVPPKKYEAMKAKAINYSIQNPCDESWNEMLPQASGRFCGACEKSVIDFTGMSDFSIVNYLESNKGQSVCGRFTEDQLAKTYLWTPVHQSAFRFDLKAVVLGLALSTFSAFPSQAQTSPVHEQYDSINEPKPMIQGAVAMTYDHTNESIVGGKILLEGANYEQVKISLMNGSSMELTSVTSSKNGTFNISLDWGKNPASIRVSAPGYITETIYFSNHPSLSNLTIRLKERRMVKGEVSYPE